jgi:hypothetical protein
MQGWSNIQKSINVLDVVAHLEYKDGLGYAGKQRLGL